MEERVLAPAAAAPRAHAHLALLLLLGQHPKPRLLAFDHHRRRPLGFRRQEAAAGAGREAQQGGKHQEAAGATFQDVVKTNLYVVGLKSEHVPIIREVRSQFVRADHPPVSTLVGISALVGPDWLIEIEAVAVVAE